MSFNIIQCPFGYTMATKRRFFTAEAMQTTSSITWDEESSSKQGLCFGKKQQPGLSNFSLVQSAPPVRAEVAAGAVQR